MMLPLSPGSENTRCHAQKADASLQRQKRSTLSKKPRRQHVQILHCCTARWSIRLTEIGAAEQDHRYEKAAAVSQFVEGFYEYSNCWLQQSEWFFPLSRCVIEYSSVV